MPAAHFASISSRPLRMSQCWSWSSIRQYRGALVSRLVNPSERQSLRECWDSRQAANRWVSALPRRRPKQPLGHPRRTHGSGDEVGGRHYRSPTPGGRRLGMHNARAPPYPAHQRRRRPDEGAQWSVPWLVLFLMASPLAASRRVARVRLARVRDRASDVRLVVRAQRCSATRILPICRIFYSMASFTSNPKKASSASVLTRASSCLAPRTEDSKSDSCYPPALPLPPR